MQRGKREFEITATALVAAGTGNRSDAEAHAVDLAGGVVLESQPAAAKGARDRHRPQIDDSRCIDLDRSIGGTSRFESGEPFEFAHQLLLLPRSLAARPAQASHAGRMRDMSPAGNQARQG